jgi:hypothetical protein
MMPSGTYFINGLIVKDNMLALPDGRILKG